jgi:hypothetical protein
MFYLKKARVPGALFEKQVQLRFPTICSYFITVFRIRIRRIRMFWSSLIRYYLYRSGSGSCHQQAKMKKKTLISFPTPFNFVTSL